MTSDRSDRGYLAAAALVVLATAGWSLAGVFVRHLPGLNGWQINCWRGLSMAIFLGLYLAALHGRETARQFTGLPAVAMVTCAGFFALGSTLYVTSLTLTSTANVSTIGALAPVFVMLTSRHATGEAPGKAAWTAALLALVGVFLIFREGLESGRSLGNLIAICVALCFAGQTLVLRRFRDYEMMPAVCIGGLAVFVVAGLAGGFDASLREIAILALMGPVQLAVPLILFARGARKVAAATLSLIALLDTVLNPLWAWMGAGEIPAMASLVGGCIIVGAVALSVLGTRRVAQQGAG
jgi:drug/metabolite transporter (DMT)-like permease